MIIVYILLLFQFTKVFVRPKHCTILSDVYLLLCSCFFGGVFTICMKIRIFLSLFALFLNLPYWNFFTCIIWMNLHYININIFSGITVPKSWPPKGDIVFEGVSLRYDENREPVITNLNLHIPAGQKVSLLKKKRKT